LAQLFYRGASEAAQATHITAAMAEQWSQVLSNHTLKTVTSAQLQEPRALAQALASAGDGALLRIRYHTAGLNFHMPEQLDKNTGDMTSAYDLTWSYATVLKAMKARGDAVRVL
jgi:glucoamylase